MVPAGSLQELERIFKALSNINRLQLLLSLQTPKGYSEIQLTPSRRGGKGSPDRAISRQAVRNHVETLQELGVVVEADDGSDRSRSFVVDHARLFAIVEQMRELATVRPTVDVGGQTMDLELTGAPAEIDGPHLALVRGVEEGRAFPLANASGGDGYVIGRSQAADVPLDYDGYVSKEHARILRKDDDFFLVDLEQNKNGTFLNWNRMTPGGVAPLQAGDVIGVGMSLLVFRA